MSDSERSKDLKRRLSAILAKMDYEEQAELESVIDGLEELSYDAGYNHVKADVKTLDEAFEAGVAMFDDGTYHDMVDNHAKSPYTPDSIEQWAMLKGIDQEQWKARISS